MKATIHNVQQGTSEWLRLRSQFHTASEAAAALGRSKYQTRTALLKQKSTGLSEEVDGAKQALFNRGHASEVGGVAIAEEILGDDLYPATATLTVDGVPLLASLDGATMIGTSFGKIICEHKLYSERLAADVRSGNLDPHYTTQMDQQLLVTGAEKCLFITSDGTKENMAYCWYEADQSKFDALIAGWKQFQSDLEAYTPTAPTAQAVAAPTEPLPAVQVSVSGQLAVISNLPEFGLALKAFIADIPKTPNTDNEFATCEAACKSLKTAEDALEQAESYSLSQMTDVEAMRRSVADLRALARTTRLAAEKMVTARKEQLRFEIVQAGRNALLEHVAALNSRLGGQYMPIIGADFALAIKGKKSVDSIQDAVSTTLANAKIEASAIADKIQANLKTIADKKEYAFLFFDLAQLVLKNPDDLAAVVSNRITEHKVKQEAERAKIAQEERERAEAAANAKAAAALDAAREADRVQLARELNEQASAAVSQAQAAQAIAKAAAPVAQAPAARPAPASAMPTLKLGTIAERLGFGLTADFLSTLGFEPTRVKSAALYHDHQFNDICAALVDHINSVCALQAA